MTSFDERTDSTAVDAMEAAATPLRPLLYGSVVVTIRAGKCGSCGTARMIFVNHGGRTQCAGCAGQEQS